MGFQRAVKHEARLRLAIAGPSGSGKTYTALRLATGLGDKIALVDTEHGAASKYADEFVFDADNLDDFHPRNYIKAIQEAGRAGYDVLILDSITHAWAGKGGLLEEVDKVAARNRSSNSFAAWKNVTPIHQQFIEAMLGCSCHLIVTMRSKTEYILEEQTRKGRKVQVPRKVGMAPVQRDGMEYEFDVLLDMDNDNRGVVGKSRCPALAGNVYDKPGEDVAAILREWLSGAPAPVREPNPEPVAEPPREEPPPAEEMATQAQGDFARNLVKSHVVTEEEREKVLAALEAGITKARCTTMLDGLKKAVDERKAAEKAAGQVEEPPPPEEEG